MRGLRARDERVPLELRPYLDFIIDSTVVGIAKPDPRVFHLGLAEAGAAPAEAVYVGDSYLVDVLGAQHVGMGVVLFDPGRLWERRDCHIAEGLCAAVGLALGDVPPSTDPAHPLDA